MLNKYLENYKIVLSTISRYKVHPKRKEYNEFKKLSTV